MKIYNKLVRDKIPEIIAGDMLKLALLEFWLMMNN